MSPNGGTFPTWRSCLMMSVHRGEAETICSFRVFRILTHTGHRRPKSATGTPAGLRNFGVIPGVMNWAVLRDFAFGSTHICRLSSQTAASQEAFMSIKRILVPLPGSAGQHTGQIETAMSVAKALGAHVQALFISEPPPVTRGGLTVAE